MKSHVVELTGNVNDSNKLCKFTVVRSFLLALFYLVVFIWVTYKIRS